MADFYYTVRDFVKNKNLTPLSSLGEKNMRNAGRTMNKHDDSSIDEAVEKFLSERDYRMKLGKHDIEELKKMLK